LGPQRLTDAHQFRSVVELPEPDVARRHTPARCPIQLLGALDHFPALLERREVPALAVRTHDPQPTLVGIERETAANRKTLERLVAAERALAKDTGGEHRVRV